MNTGSPKNNLSAYDKKSIAKYTGFYLLAVTITQTIAQFITWLHFDYIIIRNGAMELSIGDLANLLIFVGLVAVYKFRANKTHITIADKK